MNAERIYQPLKASRKGCAADEASSHSLSRTPMIRWWEVFGMSLSSNMTLSLCLTAIAARLIWTVREECLCGGNDLLS